MSAYKFSCNIVPMKASHHACMNLYIAKPNSTAMRDSLPCFLADVRFVCDIE